MSDVAGAPTLRTSIPTEKTNIDISNFITRLHRIAVLDYKSPAVPQMMQGIPRPRQGDDQHATPACPPTQMPRLRPPWLYSNLRMRLTFMPLVENNAC